MRQYPIKGVYTAISAPRRTFAYCTSFYDRLLDVKPFAIKLRRGLRRIQHLVKPNLQMLWRRATSHTASDFSGKTEIKQNHQWGISYPSRTTWNADSVRPFALLFVTALPQALGGRLTNTQFIIEDSDLTSSRWQSCINLLVSKDGFFL